MHKLTEIVAGIQHAIHTCKPMLLELALLIVFIAELIHWAVGAIGSAAGVGG